MKKSDRKCVEDCEKLTIWGYPKNKEKLQEFDFLLHRDGSVLNIPVHDTTTHKEVRRDQIILKTQDCHFGGERYWFMCPFCGKGVGVLYSCVIGKENKLVCRSCGNLTYRDRLEKGHKYFEVNRLLKKRQKVVAKMRKKGIRSRTYFRFFEQYELLNRKIEVMIGIEEQEDLQKGYRTLEKCYELTKPKELINSSSGALSKTSK